MEAGPASWKAKCTIRRVDELGRFVALEPAATDSVNSTVRIAPVPPPPAPNVPSLAPIAYDLLPVAPWDDLEDRLPPAANGDVLGVRSTQPVRVGRDGSFWAGVAAGFVALTGAAGIAYASATSEVPDLPRATHAVAHRASALDVALPEYAFEKAARGAPRVLRPGDLVTPDMLPDAR